MAFVVVGTKSAKAKYIKCYKLFSKYLYKNFIIDQNQLITYLIFIIFIYILGEI